jgi:predicted Ser/Thr protein kinase
VTDAVALGEALAPDFHILRPLGVGSTSMVYLARETELRRLVAIKVPLPVLASDPLVRGRFEREARAAARLRHPAIAAVHRIARLPDGTPYLVMEYVEGRPLDDVLAAEGRLPAATSLRLLTQVAEALAEAHSGGVIHRDVRPGNVMWLAETEQAVLLDFGIAGILETGAEVVTRLTRPGEVLGDTAYRSPEQLMGEPLTPAADIYGWGILAFEVLTLERPFAAETPAAMATAHLRHAPRSVRDAAADVDPRLADLVARALSKNPRHRPSAGTLVRKLRRLRSAGSRRVRPAGPGLVPAAVAGVPALASFLAELRRRRVYNVAIAYVAIAFILLQGAGLVLPALPLPAWAYPLAVAITLAGFPVALVLAWMYDITASGIRRTESAAAHGPPFLRWLLPTLGLIISLLLAAAIGWWVLAG